MRKLFIILLLTISTSLYSQIEMTFTKSVLYVFDANNDPVPYGGLRFEDSYAFIAEGLGTIYIRTTEASLSGTYKVTRIEQSDQSVYFHVKDVVGTYYLIAINNDNSLNIFYTVYGTDYSKSLKP